MLDVGSHGGDERVDVRDAGLPELRVTGNQPQCVGPLLEQILVVDTVSGLSQTVTNLRVGLLVELRHVAHRHGTLLERLQFLNAETLETLLVDAAQCRDMRLELALAARRVHAHDGKAFAFLREIIGAFRTAIPLERG